MTYKFKYRRNWFWHTFSVVGHTYDASQDKIILFFANGSARELSKWRECEMSLGVDWVLAQKKSLEAQAGQPITLNVGA